MTAALIAVASSLWGTHVLLTLALWRRLIELKEREEICEKRLAALEGKVAAYERLRERHPR